MPNLASGKSDWTASAITWATECRILSNVASFFSEVTFELPYQAKQKPHAIASERSTLG
jgi:hypothetical protein